VNRDLPVQLAARLRQPLPGWKAQARFQPELSFGRHLGPTPANVKPAAVLILLYPRLDQWHLPLILRPAHMPDHASQVSFPGGVIEPGEESRLAALREYSEELGAPTEEIEILGQLSPLYLFASNFQITPWVGAIHAEPSWNPSRQEVDRLLEIPLGHLIDPTHTSTIERRQRGLSFTSPCFCWESEHIWGATSMILAELLSTLAELSL